MTLLIDYESHSFPASYTSKRFGTLETDWNELLWAAIMIGRPSTYHVFRHGPASFHEAIFRLGLVRMAVEQGSNGYLRRTDAFASLDPTEKGMVSYFLGMVLCKVFAARLLQTPWLLHLDVFKKSLGAVVLGRSRPDLVGEDISNKWHAFESKGRSSAPSKLDKQKAKIQAKRLLFVGSAKCTLHVGSFAFFRNDLLEFYWIDPEPDADKPLRLPEPKEEWRFYFEPPFSFASDTDSKALDAERELTDVKVDVHPQIRQLLEREEWLTAKTRAIEMRQVLLTQGYHADGMKVTAGESWAKPFEFRERR